MELHNLKPKAGSVKARKRIGRGQGSGKGGTSTRGHKGAKSRSGYKKKRGFEGGQMPLQMRLPKRGFNNPNRVEYVPLNLSRINDILEKFNLDAITPEVLIANNITGKNDLIKILGNGELSKKVDVTAHACSANAKQAIEEKGGSVTIL
jgi:large subunit ribosomal protein L15